MTMLNGLMLQIKLLKIIIIKDILEFKILHQLKQVKKIEKTDEINKLLDEDEIFNIGDIVRVKLKANIFDKMKAKYTENLYRIKIIYKNSVDLEDLEGNIYKNIRKSDIIKIKDNQNYKPSANKIIVEQEYKTNRKLKSDGLNKANIIEGKRNRNNVKYTA